MRSRHRIPPIFSLSMLDVLCCGLGAVILLMILNFWDARRQATALAHTRLRMEETSGQLHKTETALTGANPELAKAQTTLRRTLAELQKAERDLAARRQEQMQLTSKLTGAERTASDLSRRLQDRERELADRRRDLARAREQGNIAQGELAAALERIADVERRLESAKKQLAAIDKERKEALAIAAQVPMLRRELAKSGQLSKELDEELARLRKEAERSGLALSESRTRSEQLEKDLQSARRLATDRESELARLKQRAEEAGLKLAAAEKKGDTVQVELSTLRKLLDNQKSMAGLLQQRLQQSESRFAGVDLGGRRVIFLIDTSGSMGAVDSDTPAPAKWGDVSQSVVRLFRSLPDVEKYQVILFADDARYLFPGRSGVWIDFDRNRSPDDIAAALARITPQGNTDMYSAFETAFRFRSQGLDRIYLFSDGLPNIGRGLPANPPADEAAQSALLGRYLRDSIKMRWNSGPSPVRIHSIGFFYESPNLGAFLWALSRENGGSFVGMSRP